MVYLNHISLASLDPGRTRKEELVMLNSVFRIFSEERIAPDRFIVRGHAFDHIVLGQTLFTRSGDRVVVHRFSLFGVATPDLHLGEGALIEVETGAMRMGDSLWCKRTAPSGRDATALFGRGDLNLSNPLGLDVGDLVCDSDIEEMSVAFLFDEAVRADSNLSIVEAIACYQEIIERVGLLKGVGIRLMAIYSFPWFLREELLHPMSDEATDDARAGFEQMYDALRRRWGDDHVVRFWYGFLRKGTDKDFIGFCERLSVSDSSFLAPLAYLPPQPNEDMDKRWRRECLWSVLGNEETTAGKLLLKKMEEDMRVKSGEATLCTFGGCWGRTIRGSCFVDSCGPW